MINKNNYKIKGFTLIELMLVVVIIGLIATLSITSVQTSRKKARDAKRMADVNKILQAMELYFLDAGFYPVGNNLSLGLDSSSSRCLNNAGWQVAGCANAYQDLINPDPLSSDQDYVYTRISNNDFQIAFTLEHGIDRFPVGNCRGLPSVIINCP